MISNEGQSKRERSAVNNYIRTRHNLDSPGQIGMYGYPIYNVLLFCPNTPFPASHSAPMQAKLKTDLFLTNTPST